jgi:hypothetical protein
MRSSTKVKVATAHSTTIPCTKRRSTKAVITF